MPGILKYTPAWLARPSSGFDLFTSRPTKSLPETAGANGPTRTVAQRGTEIFVAVGNELRWSDLVLLRDNWETYHRTSPTQSSTSIIDGRVSETSYRILKIPISRKIRQLVISPTGDYLAILTSHTIHVAILPDSIHLDSEDTSPLKLRTLHVGPTAHVLEQSPIATAFWHPLGVRGTCLITITVDAIVRTWELDTKNIWSFDSPTSAIDLRKLANGVASSEDFSPAKYGTSKGFSPDSFEMEVASACIGSAGQAGSHGWSSITLWVVMREGDIYALCPFLPNKCTGLSFLLPRLSTSVSCDISSMMDLENVTEYDHSEANDKSLWISELIEQMNLGNSSTDLPSVLHRPARPGVIPMLQGPFQIFPNADSIFDITDVRVISTLPTTSSETEDGISMLDEEETPIDLLCIATSEGKIQVCVNLDGVSARWLPQKVTYLNGSKQSSVHIHPELLLVESVTIGDLSRTSWPMFSSDPTSPDSLFVTHENGVSYVNFSAWSKKLGYELAEYTQLGIRLRTDLILKDAKATVEHPIRAPAISSPGERNFARDVSACIALVDSDLGLFVLASVDGEPRAVTLESSHPGDRLLDDDANDEFGAEDYLMPIHEPRPPYQPSKDFWNGSNVTELVGRHPLNKGPRAAKEEIRFSPATLKILMDVHRKLSEETHRLGQAASELFIRCERLQEEFKQQIKEVNTVADRMEATLGEDGDIYNEEDNAVGTANQIEHRIENARRRQESLDSRSAELRGKLQRLNGRPLNDKEKLWVQEIQSMENSLDKSEPNGANEIDLQENATNLLNRLAELMVVRSQLLDEFHRQNEEVLGGTFGIHDEVSIVRSSVMNEINGMLERQTALVNATKGKLERLSVMST